MGRNLNDLSLFTKKLRKNIKPAIKKVTDDTAQWLVKDLIFETPVDTSQALSNWQLSVGERVPGPIEAYYPGKKGSTKGASSQIALFNATSSLKVRKVGEIIYITNMLDYIDELNEGRSPQAEAGWVDNSIEAAEYVLSFKKLKL